MDMRIAKGIETIDLKMNLFGNSSPIFPTLIWDDQDAILVDTGTPESSHCIEHAIEEKGISLDKIKAIILTHQDIDHIGSLSELVRDLGESISIYAHPLDKPYIEGEMPLIKFNKEALLDRISGLSPEVQAEAKKKLETLPPKGNVDHLLTDGDYLPQCGGITVIHTPGHTPGHISLYCHRDRVLIAGDALIANHGRLEGPREAVTPDMEMAMTSLKKLTTWDIQKVICYHGGLVEDHVNDQIAELARQANK
ncbi:MBL fold metallo-hydrolase [Terrilactibacillus laevilacticus]|uniref:MBL fold metallo-hydrolase n=1 Tax=Terrilactibacillus laevilacticus TaxID=1380157 RepID=UPI001FE79A27|nr:MBL fold metallo-hydrolase [Terrilactibacillus laevilacticus]